ncbi:MAG TPA: hypothetical protein VFX96_09625 [Pyrinomonadaceae bacterium]|nr:hypothetical protein [Pyrinomonadaceae bacterium]
MFAESSRYFQLRTVDARTADGREVRAVVLRRLPFVAGRPTVVRGNDRLDVMAERLFSDATQFWHIADANTDLDSRELVEETGRTILVPEK